MTLLKNVDNCSTYSVRGLDNQLIAEMNVIAPGLFVRIDDLNLSLGQAVFPYLQLPAKQGLQAAINARRQKMIVNSAYRTLAAQMLLWLHWRNKRCGIKAAAIPGYSNHNNASALDIEDSHGWKLYLHMHGWKKLGEWDDMHFDFPAGRNIVGISVLAFQRLWNRCNPSGKLAEDSEYGPKCQERLLVCPAEGFCGGLVPRIMKISNPVQQGRDIGDLQLALRSHGCDLKSANMIFDLPTEVAVREFQAAKGLRVDGIAGATTQKLLGLG